MRSCLSKRSVFAVSAVTAGLLLFQGSVALATELPAPSDEGIAPVSAAVVPDNASAGDAQQTGGSADAPVSTPEAGGADSAGTIAGEAVDVAQPGDASANQDAVAKGPSTDVESKSDAGAPANPDAIVEPVKPAIPDGWHTDEATGAKQYYVDGVAVTGEREIDGKWYLFDVSDGSMLTGWQDVEEKDGASKTVYYDENGVMQYGQQKLVGRGETDESWFYLDKWTGAMAKGWAYVHDDGKWRNYDETGHVRVGQWELYSDNTNTGKKHWYYFSDEDLDERELGAITYGWKYIGAEKKWCYYTPYNGFMTKGQSYNTSNNNGGAAHWYYFNEVTGAVSYGWNYLSGDNKWAYYDDVNAWMLYGEQYKPSSAKDTQRHWYYFDDNTGAVTYGYKYIAGQNKTVFYDLGWGWMLYGWQNISGNMKYFNTASGALVNQRDDTNSLYRNYQTIKNWGGYAGKYILVLDRDNTQLSVFEGSAGNWKPIFSWLVSCGKENRTLVGDYALGTKYGDMDKTLDGGNWRYFTPIRLDQGFHSCLSDWGPEESQVGRHITAGCVRCPTEAAKWIYYNVPIGTRYYCY